MATDTEDAYVLLLDAPLLFLSQYRLLCEVTGMPTGIQRDIWFSLTDSKADGTLDTCKISKIKWSDEALEISVFFVKVTTYEQLLMSGGGSRLPYVKLPTDADVFLLVTVPLNGCTFAYSKFPACAAHIQPPGPAEGRRDQMGKPLQENLEKLDASFPAGGKAKLFGAENYDANQEVNIVGVRNDAMWNFYKQVTLRPGKEILDVGQLG